MTEKCSKCNASSRVYDSRPVKGTVRRRRECLACDNRWTTYEVTLSTPELYEKIARTPFDEIRRSLGFAVQAIDILENSLSPQDRRDERR